MTTPASFNREKKTLSPLIRSLGTHYGHEKAKTVSIFTGEFLGEKKE